MARRFSRKWGLVGGMLSFFAQVSLAYADPSPSTKSTPGAGALSDLVVGFVSVVVPQTGVRWEPAANRPWNVTLSWPLSLPLGLRDRPAHTLPAHRIVVEPGFSAGSRAVGFARVGYRAVWHPRTSVVGVGAGLGSTVEVFAPGPVRPSLGPELLLHIGKCCEPGYLVVVGRYDRFFASGPRDTFTIAAGLGFF